jgi:hypothetical protein
MNTLADEFDSIYDEDDIVEVKEESNGPLVAAPVFAPLAAKMLNGYESTMRRYAAACEAGR